MTPKKCTICGTDNRGDNIFCKGCGVKLDLELEEDVQVEKVCPNCHANYSGQTQFCIHCGEPLAIREALAEKKRGKGKSLLFVVLALAFMSLFILGGLYITMPTEKDVVANIEKMLLNGEKDQLLAMLRDENKEEIASFGKLLEDKDYLQLFTKQLRLGNLGDVEIASINLLKKVKLSLKPLKVSLAKEGQFALDKAILGKIPLSHDKTIEFTPGLYQAQYFGKVSQDKVNLEEKGEVKLSHLIKESQKISPSSVFIICKIQDGAGADLFLDDEDTKIQLPTGPVNIMAKQGMKLKAVIDTPNGIVESEEIQISGEKEKEISFAFKGFSLHQYNDSELVYINGVGKGKVEDYKKYGGFAGPLTKDMNYSVTGEEDKHLIELDEIVKQSGKDGKSIAYTGELPQKFKDDIISCVFRGSQLLEHHITGYGSSPFPSVALGSPMEKRLIQRVMDSKSGSRITYDPTSMDIDLDSIQVYAKDGRLFASLRETIFYTMRTNSGSKPSKATWEKELIFNNETKSWEMYSDKFVDNLGKNIKNLRY